jgi:antitoxin MazE
MKSTIVQIGNSRGIRLSKVLLEQAQLKDEVELEAEPGRIVIRNGSRAPRWLGGCSSTNG